MKKRKFFQKITCFTLAIACPLLVAFYPKEAGGTLQEKTVVSVWNIDTFEGGKGSRTNFLKKVAKEVERENHDLFYMINSYTVAGATQAFNQGEFPDILSFGIGFSGKIEQFYPLSHHFEGGKVDGKTLAYPWCGGGYALFSKDGFEGVGKTAISRGGSNLIEVCAKLEGVEGEAMPSLNAYVKFLGGEYRYLLGTQRDLCRFQAKGVQVDVKPLGKFCDLYQYIAQLSSTKDKQCQVFIKKLLSDETQSSLKQIGMYPLSKKSGEFASLPTWTVNVFSSQNVWERLRTEKDEKKMLEFLKRV